MVRKISVFVALAVMISFAEAGELLGRSGFIKAVFPGDHNLDDSVWNAADAVTVSEPEGMYGTGCPEHTTFVYGTYMLMEGGITYQFKGVYDDYVSLKIDGQMILSPDNLCAESRGSFTPQGATTSWHKLELRVSNRASDGGVTDSIINDFGYGGIMYKKGSAGSWLKFSTANGVDQFLIEPKMSRYVYLSEYALENGEIKGLLRFSSGIEDCDLLYAVSNDGMQWQEQCVTQIRKTDDEFPFNFSVEGAAFVRFGTRYGSDVDWSAAIDLSKANKPLIGKVAHQIIKGEDKVTFNVEVLGLGASAKKAKIFIRYGIEGESFVKTEQVATVTSVGNHLVCLEKLTCDKAYQYTVILRNSLSGTAESSENRFYVDRLWRYEIVDGCASIVDVRPNTGDIFVPSEIDGNRVTRIGDWGMSFMDAETVTVPEGVTYIGGNTFMGCPYLQCVKLPSTLRECSADFTYYSPCDRIEFYGPPPVGSVDKSLSCGYYAREFAASWLDIIDISTFKGYWQTNLQNVVIVSTAMRKNDPTVMDVRFKVLSEKPTVKVRVLAFEDGERSFAKVVRPVTFIDGTETSIGDSIAANQEHQLNWRVSADWKIDVAKVKFEVLAVEDDILPLELTTLPRIGEHPSIEYSWNVMEESRVLDALFWLYADGRAGLEITDGVLKNGGTKLADGTKLNGYSTIAYVYEGMGYRVLAGEELEHVKNISRLKLSPNGFRQYAVKTLE